MRRILYSLFIVLASFSVVLAQGVPQGMQYQAVARDLSAQVLPNTHVELEVNLLADGNADRVVYSERHALETNMLGLFSLTIGQGKSMLGDFTEVPWSSSEIWMEVKIKEDGRFVTVSNSKMLSVPYAFYAATAGDLKGGGELGQKDKQGVPAQVWSLFGNRESDPTKDKLGTTDCADLVIVTDDVERIRVLCTGAVLIDSDLDVGNDLTVQNNAEFNISGGKTTVHGDLSVINGSTTNLTGPLNVDGPTNLNNTLEVDGVTTLNNTVNVTKNSTTNLTGILNVDGVTNLNNVLNVTNASTTNLSGALNVTGITNLGSNFFVNNNSTSTLTGPLSVFGPTTISNTLDVSGCINSGGGTGEARLRFCPDIVNGNSAGRFNYPLQVSGANQGMSIQVTNWSPQNKFLAFFDGNNVMRGRIEGNTGFLVQQFQDVSESLLDYDPNDASGEANVEGGDSTYVYDQTDEVRDAGQSAIPQNQSPVGQQANAREIVDLIIISTKFIVSVVKFANSFSSIPFDIGDIFEAGVNGVLAGADLGVFLGFTITNVGIAYQSGSGDYAEWLLKHDAEEDLQFGDVVGVIGGTISKDFVDADNFMVVSAAPAVVGAMPAEEKEDLYEKIAFIGQVPVKVTGYVEIGDYILPSGKGDGLAIAVKKGSMLARDYGRIIGVAWQATDPDKHGELYQMITCAVGINQNDMSGMVEQMQVVMNSMQEAIAAMNPDYEVHTFATKGQLPGTSSNVYSMSPTNRESMDDYFRDKTYENREELGQVVLTAMETKANLDMSRYPVIKRMLEDPAYAAQAEAHYSQLLGTYTDWLAELQGN